MNLCLRPASCPYRLYPYDTLCTYGVKQLKLLGFSQRHLFWCSLMAENRNFDRNSLRGVQHQFRGGAVILGNAPPLLSIVRCQNHLPQLHPNAR